MYVINSENPLMLMMGFTLIWNGNIGEDGVNRSEAVKNMLLSIRHGG